MSFNIFQTGVSGLLAYQTALGTIGHNIANSATEGYSRQRTEFAARPGSYAGRYFVGSGTEVSLIRRVYDQFLTEQIFRNTTGLSRLQTFYGLATQADNVLGDPATSVSTGLQQFFDAIQTLSNDPSALPARDAMLGDAQALIDRFHSIDGRMNDLEREINSRLATAVEEVNTLTEAIANVNENIARASATGAVPNDLLDQRDQLIQRLNEQVEVTTVQQEDGSVNVFVANGLAVVHGFESERLGLVQNEHNSGRLDVAYLGSGASMTIRNGPAGGVIGGALDFRREVLDPTRNAIGRIALGFVESFNAQHHEGMDLLGNLGGDFFSAGGPAVAPSSSNTGAASFAVQIDDLAALTGQDYVFTFDGVNWNARDAATNAAVSFTGSGTALDPFMIGGVAIEVSGAAAAGDSFLVQPTANVVRDMELLITDPAMIAAASPVQTQAALANLGSGVIDGVTILDATDPNLLATVDIVFIDANNYSVNGGPPQAYTSGGAINVNGWSVQITGAPQAGDQFTVQANTGATGDNRNALELAALQSVKLLNGATQTLESAYSSLVADVGGETQHAGLSLEAQSMLLEQSMQARYAISGVNLDEEAANLLRFQQAYSAAAQVVSVADEIFEVLLGAVGR
jgi:flagellar hook-associated protein 1 FlgK